MIADNGLLFSSEKTNEIEWVFFHCASQSLISVILLSSKANVYKKGYRLLGFNPINNLSDVFIQTSIVLLAIECK